MQPRHKYFRGSQKNKYNNNDNNNNYNSNIEDKFYDISQPLGENITNVYQKITRCIKKPFLESETHVSCRKWILCQLLFKQTDWYQKHLCKALDVLHVPQHTKRINHVYQKVSG
jgi:hypothetical protein